MLFPPRENCPRFSGKRVVIDYVARELCVHNTDQSGCSYPFIGLDAASDEKTAVFRERNRMMAAVEVLNKAAGTGGMNQVTLRFGGLLNRLKTVVDPVLQRFGMLFKPQQEQVVVVADHQYEKQLREIAGKNEPEWGADPILRRLDPLGLITVAGGVIMTREDSDRIIEYTYILNEYPSTGEQCLSCTE